MNKTWIKYICDPMDRSELHVHSISKIVGDDIIKGILKSKSNNYYKIKNGVPILLSSKTQSKASVESFAYEWNKFDFDYGKKGWLADVIKPVVGDLSYFKNKTIVDCGAGSGRQSSWMAQAGAKFVFSLELSDAAQTITKRVTDKFKYKIFVIQCDISHIPINIKKVKIDLVYCVNVIQHTKNPAKTVIELTRLLSRKSRFIFNIYLQKGRDKLLKTLEIFRFFANKLSYRSLKYICFLLAKCVYPMRKIMPISHSFKETWLAIYDILGSHAYQKFYTEGELQEILSKAGLKIVKRSKYALLLKLE